MENQEILNALQVVEGRNLANISNEELVEILPCIREFSTKVWSARNTIEQILIERMYQTNATKIVNDGLIITLQQQKTREFNDEVLKELLDILSDEDRKKAVTGYKVLWSWKYLKELTKRGGKILEIITNATVIKEKPYLKVERKNNLLNPTITVLPEANPEEVGTDA